MALSPSDMICFALYSASHAMQGVYRPLLDELGITYPQFLVLNVLWAADGPLTVSGIGAVLHLESSTLTPLLKRLETAQLVVRKRDEKDERQVQVSLTAKGDALHRQTQGIPTCIAQKTHMNEGQLEHLNSELTRLSENLRDNSYTRKPR